MPSLETSELPWREARHPLVNDSHVPHLDSPSRSRSLSLVFRPRLPRRTSVTMQPANSDYHKTQKQTLLATQSSTTISDNAEPTYHLVEFHAHPADSEYGTYLARPGVIPYHINANVPSDLMKPNKSRIPHLIRHSNGLIAKVRLSFPHLAHNRYQSQKTGK